MALNPTTFPAVGCAMITSLPSALFAATAEPTGTSLSLASAGAPLPPAGDSSGEGAAATGGAEASAPPVAGWSAVDPSNPVADVSESEPQPAVSATPKTAPAPTRTLRRVVGTDEFMGAPRGG